MAKTGRINFGGGGGIDPDELNAKPEHVLNGIVFGGFESDDPQKGAIPNNGTTANKALNCGGTFTVKKGYHAQDFNVTANNLASQTSATATAGYIYSGKTAWVNGNKITGNMTVGSILNFSAAAYSGRQILLKWQNPYAATGKPFSGVFINYSTSGYPGSGGTRIYTGSGNNNASGGWSQVIVTMPNLNTTYYFSATAYCSCSANNINGNTINASTKTQAELWLTFNSSQNYTIPTGYNTSDFFAVGGGASGEPGDVSSGGGEGGGGGGSGYTSTVKNLSISSGQILSIIVGSGGAASNSINNPGNVSSISRNGTILCSAAGGKSDNYSGRGKDGGSGGGATGYEHAHNAGTSGGCHGGSNGSSGYGTNGANGTAGGILGGSYSGSGQGTNTRAWGTSTGTLYAGGGGGGGSAYGTGGVVSTGGGHGGAGGGAGGGNSAWEHNSDDLGTEYYSGSPGSSGSANTGGGGGGAGWQSRQVGGYTKLNGGAGGSGIVLLHLY